MSKGVVLESYSIKENQRKRRGKTKKIIIKKKKIKSNQRKSKKKSTENKWSHTKTREMTPGLRALKGIRGYKTTGSNLVAS